MSEFFPAFPAFPDLVEMFSAPPCATPTALFWSNWLQHFKLICPTTQHEESEQ